MVKLFYEYLETAHEAFAVVDRPITDTVLRLLNDSYLKTVDDICRADTFVMSAEKTRANLEILKKLVDEQDITPDGTLEPGRYQILSTTISGEYAYYLRSMASITRTAVPVITPAEWVETQPIHDTEIDALAITIYNNPIIRKPGISFSMGTLPNQWSLNIYVDSYSVLETLKLLYIRAPEALTFEAGSECLLSPESTCHSVVKMAVDQFISTKAVFTPKTQPKQQTA